MTWLKCVVIARLTQKEQVNQAGPQPSLLYTKQKACQLFPAAEKLGS